MLCTPCIFRSLDSLGCTPYLLLCIILALHENYYKELAADMGEPICMIVQKQLMLLNMFFQERINMRVMHGGDFPREVPNPDESYSILYYMCIRQKFK